MNDSHDAPDPTDVTLVPIDDDGAVAVFASSNERALDVLAQLRQFDVSAPANKALDRAVSALGFAGAAAEGTSSAIPALASLRGVVQLAPETMKLLHSGNSLMQAAATGQQMGTVVNGAGTVVAHARFVPMSTAVAATSVATVAASLGPAVALAAIQFQLNRLENLLGQVRLITQTLLDEARTNRWAEVEARIDRIRREVTWVMDLGTVPGHMVDSIAADAVTLHSFALATTELLSSRVRDLSGRIGSKEKYELLEQLAQAIVRDAVDLSLSADAWLAVETLRSFHIQQDDDPVAQEYGKRVYEHALSTSETWRAEANRTLTDVQRLLSRIAVQEPHVLRRQERRSASLARRIATALSSALPDVEPTALTGPAGTPGIEDATTALILQEARWVLAPGSTVETLFAVSIDRHPGFMLQSRDHVLVARTEEFVDKGQFELLVPVEDSDDELEGAEFELTYAKPDGRLVRQGRRAATGVVERAGRLREAARRLPDRLTSEDSADHDGDAAGEIAPR